MKCRVLGLWGAWLSGGLESVYSMCLHTVNTRCERYVCMLMSDHSNSAQTFTTDLLDLGHQRSPWGTCKSRTCMSYVITTVPRF